MLGKTMNCIMTIVGALFDFTFILPIRLTVVILLSLYKILTCIDVIGCQMVTWINGKKLSDELKKWHNEFYDTVGRLFKFKNNTSEESP